MLQFSLIVCTRGRPALLERLLLGIAQLRYPEFELIVICDPNDTETAQCLAQHAERAKIGHCAPANLALARNIGLALAQSEIAAFIDDDSVPEPDWLDRLAAGYTGPEITAAGGAIRGRNGIKFQSRIVLIDKFGADHHRARPPHALPGGRFLSLTGTNFSVRRNFAMALGGFDENYSYFLEETDFLYRLCQAGGEIRIADLAEVHHGYGPSEMRAESGTPKSLRDIARSKAYFCHVNCPGGASISAIHRALARFVAVKCWLIASHLLSGRLSAANAARLFKELQAGLRDGATLAKKPRSLHDFPNPSSLTLQPFQRQQAPRRRLCVLMKTAPAHCPQWPWIGKLGRADYEVTVLHFGAGILPRVNFAEGVWRHRLSAAWPVLRLSWFAIAAELRRISAHRRFELIHVASDDRFLRKAAAASGLQLFSLSDDRPPQDLR